MRKDIEFKIWTALFAFGFLSLVIGGLGSQWLEGYPHNMIRWEWGMDGFQMWSYNTQDSG